MSIRAKILLGCLSLTCITVLLGLLSRSAQQELGDIALRLYDEAFMSMSYLRSAQNSVTTIARDLAQGSADPAETADRLDQAAGDLQVAQQRAMSPEGRSQAEALQRDLGLLSSKLRSTGTAPGSDILEPVEQSFDEAVEVYAGDGYRSRRAAVALVAQTIRQTWTATGLSIAVAFAITAVLTRAIVPSLRRAVQIATAIAAGTLDNRIDSNGRSETGVLLRALASMQASIAGKIARIEALMAQQATSHATEIAGQNIRFAAALDNMTQGLCMVGAGQQLQICNRRFAEMFGTPAPGASAAEALPEPLRTGAQDGAQDGAQNGAQDGAQNRAFTATLDDGRVISVAIASMAGGGHVATYEDVSERHRAEARMQHMARHDALTGLPNRVLFRERAEQALALARRSGGLAVLCLGLDRFKIVNDSLGHPAGDALLRSVAARLLDETRNTDTVVRLGGDEFAIIQISPHQPQDAKILAERLIDLLSLPFDIDGQTVLIGTSIGIVTAVDGMETADSLLKNADLALHRAKADGRGIYRFFETDMDAHMQARRVFELDLRRAVAERQFEVHYQPLIAAETGQVSGFEALARWRHPERGMVPPGEFIPVAEETGAIAAIGLFVLNQACDDAVQWPPGVKVAVNLSPLQFRSPGLAGDVATALRRSGLPAERLELEITESLLLQDSDTVLAVLHQIRALGVHISMDDFGTGYSSLSYLRRFPFDKIKIDQSFIRNLEQESDCIAIVRAVVGLGRSLGMTITAEGVETVEQQELLRHEGCHQLQGYLFSRPTPAAAVLGLIRRFALSPLITAA